MEIFNAFTQDKIHGNTIVLNYSLDNESEAVVQKALSNLIKDRTVLIIAHRLSTIKNASRIIVIDNGHIVEEGSHEYLLENGTTYKKLYELQYGLN